MNKYILKLYVTGKTVRSENAIRNLKSICLNELKGEYELKVIDVLESPDSAEKDKVMATPTLIKSLPPPIRRLVGDLNDRDRVLLHLDIQQINIDKNGK
jgi:circadian clock protein KaiB